MKFTNVAGARIIEALTSGLYDGNSNCVREYIQNAVDSHSKTIEIEHLNEGQDISIRDYGDGMDHNQLLNALKFGYSVKSTEDVGWRGIGIYSGIPNFSAIHINTKKKDGKKLHVTILCEEIINAYLGGGTLEEVLEKGIPGEIEEIEDPEFKPGTQVLLNNVESGQKIFFEESALKDELIKVLPLPMAGINEEETEDLEVRQQLRQKIISSLLDAGVKEPEFKVKYHGSQLFRPPLDFSLFDLDSLVTGKIESQDGTPLCSYWILTSKANKQLGEPHRGILFKKWQFTIGNADTFRRVAPQSYNYWNYGEIHVLDRKILENAARNFFEINSGHAREFIGKIETLLEEVQRNNRKKSAKDKQKELTDIKTKIDAGEIFEAEKQLKKVQESLQHEVTGAASPGLSSYSEVLQSRGEEQKVTVNQLKSEIKSKKADRSEQEFQEVFSDLPKDYKKMVQSKVADIHQPTTFNHIMDGIEKELKSRAGSNKNEFLAMLKDVFSINEGADLVKVKSDCKLFLVDPSIIADGSSNGTTIKYSYYLTTEFAHFLNSLYQLFVNGEKHHSDKIGEILFNGKSKKEIAEFYRDLKHTISLCERLVNITKKRNEIGALP